MHGAEIGAVRTWVLDGGRLLLIAEGCQMAARDRVGVKIIVDQRLAGAGLYLQVSPSGSKSWISPATRQGRAEASKNVIGLMREMR